MTAPPVDRLRVEKCDREAAADAVMAYRDRKNGDWQQRIRDGKCDDGEMVQAFAKHRHQALLEQAARVAKLESALKNIIDAADSFCDESGDEVAAQVKIRARKALQERSE